MFAYFPLADSGLFAADADELGSALDVKGRRADAEDVGLDVLGPGLRRADVEDLGVWGLGIGAGVWRARNDNGLGVADEPLPTGVDEVDELSKAWRALN